MSTFIMLKRGETSLDLLKHHPNAFLLLTLIALRARRTPNFIKKLDICECQIGDYRSCGLTEQKYRTAKKVLEDLKIATFHSTNKGTIAKIINSDIYNINIDVDNYQANTQATSKQRASNEQATTNNNVNKDNKEKNVNTSRFKKPSLEEIKEYCIKRNNRIDPEYFFDYQESRGWVLSNGKKMKDFKATIRTWEKNNKPEPQKTYAVLNRK